MTPDETRLPELTRRQEEILALIVRSYTQRPEPISSKHLLEAYNLSFSSATIRNEMAVLEELGYIGAPHTSAGRIPTQDGYRYFVRRLIGDDRLSSAEQTHISERLQSQPLATDNWMRLVATMLARTVQTAALVTPPIAQTSKFKHLELIAIQGRLALMVLVLHEGTLHQQMLTLAEPLPQARLSETAERINAVAADLSAAEVRFKGVSLGVLEREITELAADLMERADSKDVRLVYREGLSDMIGVFDQSGNAAGAQQAVRVFEERAVLNLILSDVLTPMMNQVQVLIGGDGRWEELKHLSMVLSRYGVGQLSGAVGVLGPTHLNYGRAISAVSYVSGVMTNMLTAAYATEDAADGEKDEVS